jgi:ABC-type branched-subunit amino acid transport system substrate-binding protein
VKNKVLLISLIVVLAASLAVGAVGCGDGAAGPSCLDKIVVGSSRSITGAFASIHVAAFGAICPAYVGDVNNRSPNPGIPVGGTYFPMDYKFLNDGSNPATMSSHINTLISDVNAGDVHTIFGPTCTYFIDVAAPITNAASVVMITVEGGATYLKLPGYIDSWPYVFTSLSYSDWYQLPVLAPILKTEKSWNDVYTCWQRDAHGEEYMAGAWGDPVKGITGSFDVIGLNSVGNSSVLNSADPPGWAATLVSTIDAQDPEVVCLFCYPDEIWAILAAADAANYNEPDMWVIGPGGCFGFFGTQGPANPPAMGLPPSWGAKADGMMTFAVGNNETNAALQDMFNNKLYVPIPDPYALLDMWGHPCYWAAMQMWEEAIKAVATTCTMADGTTPGILVDQDDLKDELASYNSAGTGVTTVLGTTWFSMFGTGGGMLDYECHTGEIGQWQDGLIEIIAPTNVLDLATNTTVAIGTLLPNYTNTTDTIRTWCKGF